MGLRAPIPAGDVETAALLGNVVIWTTTPWTIPGNRAIAYSTKIDYGLYEVTAAPDDNWAKVGDKFVLADALAENLRKLRASKAGSGSAMSIPHGIGRRAIPSTARAMISMSAFMTADFVTEETGTGFVHTAPGHGADDYELFVKHRKSFAEAGIPDVPHTVREDGFYFEHVPLFGGAPPEARHRRQGQVRRRQ